MSTRRAAVRPLPLLALAVASAGALVAAYGIFIRTHHGQRIDQGAFDGRALATPAARHAAHDLLTTIGTGSLALALAALVALALVRRRAGLALLAGATIGGALLCTELLKHLLPRPDLAAGSPYQNTFPSGHTTIAFAVGVAATIVVPPRLRRRVALAAVVYGAAVGIAAIAAGWHRPSDVAGALLVVIGWTALVVLAAASVFPSVLGHGEQPAWRGPALARDPLAAIVALLALGYLAALAIVLARRAGAIDWTLLDGAFVAACAAVATLAAVLMAVLLSALRATLSGAR